MKLIIVDSSVIVKWLHKEDELYLKQADKIINEAQNKAATLLAPELAKYEVGNALLFSKKLSLKDANTILSSFYLLPIQFIFMSKDLANETYKIALESGITYYDASFVALAKRENATLVTDNPKHQAKQLRIKVISLKEY